MYNNIRALKLRNFGRDAQYSLTYSIMCSCLKDEKIRCTQKLQFNTVSQPQTPQSNHSVPNVSSINPPKQPHSTPPINPPKHPPTTKSAQPTAPSQQAKSPPGATQTPLPPQYQRDSIPASKNGPRRAEHDGGPANYRSRSTGFRTPGRTGIRLRACWRLRSRGLFRLLRLACGRLLLGAGSRCSPRG